MASLADALRVLKTEFTSIKREVVALRATRVLPEQGKRGKPGLDGRNPSLDELLAIIPAPIPGKDGLDGVTPTIEEITALIPAPVPGRDGADGVTPTRAEIRALVPAPIPGKPGKQGKAGKAALPAAPGQSGKQGPRGKPGASITDVKLEGVKLAVWIDGVKKVVGTLKMPLGPFTPGASGGGGGFRRKPGEFSKQNFTADGEIASTTTLAVSHGANTLLMPPGHVGILEIKSAENTATLDPTPNTIEGGDLTVTETVNRRFNLDGEVWLEL